MAIIQSGLCVKSIILGILSSPSYFRPPSDLDYILDNGAFWRDGKNGDEWDDKLFYKIVDRLCLDGGYSLFCGNPRYCMWGGLKSLEHSQKHIGKPLPMGNGTNTSLCKMGCAQGTLILGRANRWYIYWVDL